MACLKAGNATRAEPYFVVSDHARVECEQKIAAILRLAQDLGQQYGQTMVSQTQESKGVGPLVHRLLQRVSALVTNLIDRVRTLIRDALDHVEDDADLEQVVQDVVDTAIESIPDLVADTHIHTAVEQGVLAILKTSAVTQVIWVANPDACDLCQDLVAQGPRAIDEEWQGGITVPPAHPRCKCNIRPFEEHA